MKKLIVVSSLILAGLFAYNTNANMCRDLLEKREMNEQAQIVKSQLDAYNKKDI